MRSQQGRNRKAAEHAPARDRLLGAAYKLFSERGVSQVGIDAILDESGCAKASLYNNFDSKDDLAIAFLDRHDEVWTLGWLREEVLSRAKTPEKRLLAFFDVFDMWFRKRDFAGCAFVRAMLESAQGSPVRRAAAGHLASIRQTLATLAKEAKLRDAEQFAEVWLMLLLGSMVSACKGVKDAGLHAKRGAEIVLAGWATR